MELTPLTLKDKTFFDAYLRRPERQLCAYAFENIYSWSRLYHVSWAQVDGNLCVFFKDPVGSFAYLPPLGGLISAQAVKETFAYLRKANTRHPGVSRIENVGEEDIGFFRGLGYNVAEKFGDYVYRRAQLAALAGDRFKSPRASVNYCSKHYRVRLDELRAEDSLECLRLYRSWGLKKKAANTDPVFCGMIDDSFTCLEALCGQYKELACAGVVARIEGVIRAFSVGYPVSSETFCIAFETADVSVKGLAQYIFRGFAGMLKGYTFINAMDDSGLASLRRVKRAYRPARIVPAYIVEDHG